jgi:phage terminase small subunit
MSNGKSPYDLLTPMQQDFVNYYLISLNATEAAEKAGFSAKTARQKGSQLLSKVNIQAAIEEERKKKAAQLAIEQDNVLLEVASILHARLDDVVEWSAESITFKELEDIPMHARKAIKKITVKTVTRTNDSGETSETTRTVEMHDKVRAAEFMGKYFGLTTGDKGNGGDNASGANPGDSSARGRRILDAVRRMSGTLRKAGPEGESV